MKLKTIIFLLCCFVCSSIQAQADSISKRKGPFIENDTTFLYKHFSKDKDNYVAYENAYIETNRESKFFQRILSDYYFTFQHGPLSNEEREYNYTIELQKKGKNLQTLKKHSLKGLANKKWIPLNRYKGKYYLDGENCKYVTWLTDSVYVHRYMDGPKPYILQSFKKINKRHFYFRYTRGSIYPATNKYTESLYDVELYIVDPKQKIAVTRTLEYDNHAFYYRLWIAHENAASVDMIEYDSNNMPLRDVPYDRIDFLSLIKEIE